MKYPLIVINYSTLTFLMKIVLTTTLVAVLAIGLLGINNSSSNNINNAFAQEGAITPGGMNDTMGNESTTTSGDKSIPGQMVTNATLANPPDLMK